MFKILLLCSSLLFVFISGCSDSSNQQKNTNPAAMVDASLPNFAFENLDGEQMNLQDFKGKVVVVNFWATWCPPCRKEMPLFVEFQEKYGAKGLQFIGLAIDEPGLVRDFADVYSINFPVNAGSLASMQIAKDLGNRFGTLPFTVIFDRDGKLVFSYSGEFDHQLLQEKIDPLL